jgi:ABC-type nickel/cobalt efflux system permease component RcnA
MEVTKATYFKALLLLIAFSMSTVVSFACSFSDLFHEFHHHNSPATKAHKHNDQKEHTHDHSGSHHDTSPREEKKDNCCSHSIVELQKVEKSISRNIEALNLNSSISFVAAGLELFSLPALRQIFSPDFVRWRPPATIQDLRILIQSFQI